MGDAKHTPGPWRFLEVEDHASAENSCRPLTICGPSDDDLASVYSSDDSTVSISREEAVANARLIAAAPEMRDAIKEKLAADDAMLAFILNARPSELGEEEWDRQHKTRCDRGRAATEALRAALSKAGV